jgi:hypothetical protein
MPQFFVMHRGRQLGPFTDQQLREMAAQGTLDRESIVVDAATKRAVAAGAVPGLAFPVRSAGGMAPEGVILPPRSSGAQAAPPGHDSGKPRLAMRRGPPVAAPPPGGSRLAFDPLTADHIDDSHEATRDGVAVPPNIPPPPAPTAQSGTSSSGPDDGGGNSLGVSIANPVLFWSFVGGVVAILALVMLVVVAFAVAGSGGLTGSMDPHIRQVQTGRLEGCRHKTVLEMTNGFLKKPRWKSLLGDDGLRYVNCSGEFFYAGRPAIAEIQFEVTGSTFNLRSLEIDGEPQNLLTRAVLIKKMCEE